MKAFAGVPGLEPRLTEPESVVLPITPYPTRCPSPAPTDPNQHRGRMLVDHECPFPLGCRLGYQLAARVPGEQSGKLG
jgi:hypothetical protein